MPDLEWNKRLWNDQYAWTDGGDEWSSSWGGPRPQWYGAIFPRIARWLPARRMLEIAPGFGRWTQFLLPQTEEYHGVDLNLRCVQRCQQRFSAANRAHFVQNDGRSLEMIADNTIDFAFSFDSLVHVELDVLGSYCEQIVRKLDWTGVAFIHHSNAAKGVDDDNPTAHARGKSVSSAKVKAIVEKFAGRVLIQEEINWGSEARIDCLTTFCKANAHSYIPNKLLLNDNFMQEAALIKATLSAYY